VEKLSPHNIPAADANYGRSDGADVDPVRAGLRPAVCAHWRRPRTATKFLVQYIYETGFANQIPLRGLAAAASVLLGLVLLVFTLVQLWLGRQVRSGLTEEDDGCCS